MLLVATYATIDGMTHKGTGTLISMPEDQCMWLTGLYEGEGTLFFGEYPDPRRPGAAPRKVHRLAICMRDEDIIQRCFDLTKVGKVDLLRKPAKQEHSQMHRWYLGNKDQIGWLLCRMYPYLGLRRREQMDKFVINSTIAYGGTYEYSMLSHIYSKRDNVEAEPCIYRSDAI